MSSSIRKLLILVICGFLFLVDRWLKWQALHEWSSDRLINRWFGWHPFANYGVAFGIPVPSWLIVGLTLPVLMVLLYAILNYESRIMNHGVNGVNAVGRPIIHNSYFLILIFFGALSNLLDRVVYGHTVDYLLIFTGVINLADVMIVSGFVMAFL